MAFSNSGWNYLRFHPLFGIYNSTKLQGKTGRDLNLFRIPK